MKNFLVVVDMQNDFITGSLGSDAAQVIAPGVAARIVETARDGYSVIFTLDTHGEDYLATPEGKALPVAHCIKGSEGWELHPEIKTAAKSIPYDKVAFIEKPNFGTVRWDEFVTDGDSIEFVGLCTDICVVTNALIVKTLFPSSPVSVNPTLCAGTSLARHNSALDTMRSCQIKVL